MQLPPRYNLTKIYAIGDSSTKSLPVDVRFRNVTITTQPLTLSTTDTIEEINNNVGDHLIEANAVAAASVSGTVTITATPPDSFHNYTLPESEIDLSDPHFISTQTPMTKANVVLDSIAGCTHVAVSITGFIN